MDDDEEFSLDEARETLFTLQRACERHAARLAKIVEELNAKKEDDEWLESVLEEADKGVAFHEQQLVMCTRFHSRASEYVEEVRREADALAIRELQGRDGEEGEDGAAEGQGEGEGQQGQQPEEGEGGVAAGPRRKKKSGKIIHPELLKFKLEKQARILGKYGGVPALGTNAVLPRLMKESILKATGSPAAREIHYSRVENKDAARLATVMQFKVRKADDAAAQAAAQSPWQAELSAKKGKSALDGTDAKDQVTPSTRSHAAYGQELGGVLEQRQAAVAAAIEAEQLAAKTPGGVDGGGPRISAAAGDELAEQLRRRQAAAKAMEDAAAAAAAEAAEAEAPPTTPGWINANAPFGMELTGVLQRRQEQQRRQSVAAAGGTPVGSGGGAGDGGSGEAGGAGGSGGGAAATPGLVTPVSAVRRAPFGSAATPASAMMSNELAERLKRRAASVSAGEGGAAGAAGAPGANGAAGEAGEGNGQG